MIYLVALMIFGAGLFIGLILPDIDTTVRFLQHRSIITHNFIWPLLAAWLGRGQGLSQTRIRLFTIGFSIALAAHFSFDLFPRAWRGFALLNVPFYGRTEATFSWIWLALSMLLCVYIATSLLKSTFDVALLMGGGLVSFALMATAEPFGWPLSALAIAVIVVMAIDWERLPRRRSR